MSKYIIKATKNESERENLVLCPSNLEKVTRLLNELRWKGYDKAIIFCELNKE